MDKQLDMDSATISFVSVVTNSFQSLSHFASVS